MHMFEWYWLLVAAAAGAVIGTLVASLCAAAKNGNQDNL